MAPTINTTKLVATAIATFASTDKFMILPSIFPSIIGGHPMTHLVLNLSFLTASNFSAPMDVTRSIEKKG
jgi:hypothetical protein